MIDYEPSCGPSFQAVVVVSRSGSCSVSAYTLGIIWSLRGEGGDNTVFVVSELEAGNEPLGSFTVPGLLLV